MRAGALSGLPEGLADLMLETLADAVLAVAPGGRVVALNPAAARLFGLPPDAPAPRIAELLLERPELDPLLDLAFAAGEAPERELRLPSGGEERVLLVRARRLPAGGPAAVLLVATDITAHVRAEERRVEAGRLIITLVVTMLVAATVRELAGLRLGPEAESPLFGWLYFGLLLPPALWLARRSGLSGAEIGLSAEGGGRALAEGLAVAALFSALAAALWVSFGPAAPVPGVEGVRLDGRRLTAGFMLSYLAFSFAQELLARGIIQTSLARVRQRPLGAWDTVALSAVVFGVAHAFAGPLAVLVTVLGGLVLGWLRARHRSLLGVGLAHALIGWTILALGGYG